MCVCILSFPLFFFHPFLHIEALFSGNVSETYNFALPTRNLQRSGANSGPKLFGSFYIVYLYKLVYRTNVANKCSLWENYTEHTFARQYFLGKYSNKFSEYTFAFSELLWYD